MSKTPSVMIDPAGREVPTRYVSPFDRARDRSVRGVAKEAFKLRASLERFVARSIGELGKVAHLKDKDRIGEKGNFSVSSFDGLFRVGIRQRYVISFDARAVRARDLMRAYIDGVLAKFNDSEAKSLRVIVDDCFRSSSNGFLSTSKVFSLLRMNIDNAQWREAADLLRSAILPERGKCYLQVEYRKTIQDNWRLLRLDSSDCFPRSIQEDGYAA